VDYKIFIMPGERIKMAKDKGIMIKTIQK